MSKIIFTHPRILCPHQAFLANEDLGDSMDSVEALIKKHEDFEKSLAAQEEKIKVSAGVIWQISGVWISNNILQNTQR